MKIMAGTRTTAFGTVKGVVTKTKNNGMILMNLILPRGARKADKKATKAKMGKVEIKSSPPKISPMMLAKVM